MLLIHTLIPCDEYFTTLHYSLMSFLWILIVAGILQVMPWTYIVMHMYILLNLNNKERNQSVSLKI